jgi:hypothetical protein
MDALAIKIGANDDGQELTLAADLFNHNFPGMSFSKSGAND